LSDVINIDLLGIPLTLTLSHEGERGHCSVKVAGVMLCCSRLSLRGEGRGEGEKAPGCLDSDPRAIEPACPVAVVMRQINSAEVTAR
jgi:hypothetical protein